MKRKLLLAALCVVGALGMRAQASYNHVYTQGVTVNAGGDYFLYNIGAGMFLTDGMDYGTHASVDHAGRVVTLATATNGYSIYTKPYSANGTAEKAGYMTLNGYVDTGNNDADWVFTPVDVDGYTNAYTIKHSDTQYLYYEVKDGLYNGKMGAFVNVGNNTNNAASYWLLIPMSARQDVNDYTYLLRNTDFHHPWELPMWTNEAGWTNIAGGLKENACAEMYGKGFDIYQTISATVANGKYKLYNQAFYNNADAGNQTYLYANDDQAKVAILNANNEGTASNMAGASTSFTAGHYVNEVTTIVTDGSLKVGIKNATTAGNAWSIMDNFYLEYLGSCLVNDAIPLPEGGAMEADKWYYFDITAAANNYAAAATTLNDIIFVQDNGKMLTAEANASTQKFTEENNDLVAGRYYVKSTSANNLVVSVSSYSYSLGTPAFSIADGSYAKTLNTFTVTFANAQTNDPDGTLALLNNTAKATLTKGGSNVAEGTLSVSGKDLIATFSEVSLDLGSTYSIDIAADVFGYDGKAANEAINISFNTPVIADGIYYFFNTDTKKYLSRGNTWGTQAITDDYGLPAYINFGTDGTTKVQFFDNNKYLSDGGWLYADNGTGGSFLVEAVSGGYKLKDVNSGKYVALYDGIVVGDAVEGGNLQGTSNIWALETPAQYKAKDNATTLANAQAAAAAAAAGLTGITTKAALETELAANYGETTITITGAKGEKYNQNASGGDGGVLNENKYVEETVSNLKPGLYRLSVDAFQRALSYNQRLLDAEGARSLIYLYAGAAKTQIMSVMEYGAGTAYANDYTYDGKHYPNNESSAYTALETGKYKNDVYVYVAADESAETGSLTFGINNPQNATGCGIWAVYENFTLTRFDAKATETEKQALANAITAAAAKTLGFEAGEYAPYNNVAAVQALAAAKAIDTDAASGEAVVAATTALTGATWTANTAEVNAVYNGTFALSVNDGAMAGWTISNNQTLGGALHARAFVLTSGMNNYDNLAAFGQGDGTRSCAYMRFDGTNSGKDAVYTYGATDGYTMPLKAKVYRLTAQLGGWGQVDKDITINVVNSNNNTVVATTTVHTPTTAVSAGGGVVDVAFPVEIETAGDYKLTINNGSNADNAIVISNIELYKMPNIVIAANGESSTAYDNTLTGLANVTLNRPISVGYNTLVLPFDVTADEVAEKFGTEAKVYVVSEYESAKDNIKLTAQDGIEANKPVILKATTAGTSYEFTNKALVAAEAAPTAVGEGVSMVGNYTAVIDVPKNSNAYVINGDKIYYVDSDVIIRNTRAYISVAGAHGTKSRVMGLSFGDEDATGINAVEGAKAADNDAIYNLSGQRVGKDYKGIVIKNGKKVMNK